MTRPRKPPRTDADVLRELMREDGPLAAYSPWLTARDIDVLRDLSHRRWMQPMHVGGRSGSHHSATLAKLARHGLAERNKNHGRSCLFGQEWNGKLVTRCRCKGSCLYRRTAAGIRVIEIRFGIVLADPFFSQLHGKDEA